MHGHILCTNGWVPDAWRRLREFGHLQCAGSIPKARSTPNIIPRPDICADDPPRIGYEMQAQCVGQRINVGVYSCLRHIRRVEPHIFACRAQRYQQLATIR